MFKGSLSIKKTLLIVFIVLGVINVAAYFLLFTVLHNNEVQISAAGKIQVLTQKIAYQSNLHFQGHARAKDIATQAIDQFDELIDALKEGGVVAGFPKKIENASGSAAIQLEKTDILWKTFKINAGTVLKSAPGNAAADPEVQTALNYLNNNAELLLNLSSGLAERLTSQSQDHHIKAQMFLFGGVIILLISLIATLFYLNTSLVQPLNYFKQKLQWLAAGDYEQQVKYEGKKDYNQIAQYLGQVFDKLKLMASFIESIGQGKLDYHFDESKQDIVKNDKIFIALEKTQSELVKVEQENSIRQWSNEGIRIISELLQKRHDNIQELYDKLVATIVKYVDGNQGGIFLVSDDEDNVQLELTACYAYERKKFLHEKFDAEEGLLGQAFKEKNIIHLTDVPDQYVKITSGLGKATPNSLILVPLKDNEVVVGVMEIASFGKFELHRIEFLEKISELIASALNTIIVNERTKALLAESQQQTEEMKAQEEEMRQNMEELQATQEEMVRKEREISKLLEEASMKEEQMMAQEEELKQNMEEMAAIQENLQKRAKEAEKVKERLELENAMFTGLMDVLNDRVTIKDKKGAYLRVNKTKEESMKASGITEYKGKTDADIFDEEHYKKSLALEQKIMESGQPLLDEESKLIMKDGKVLWAATSRIPFKNHDGEVLGTLIITRDITKEKTCEERLTIAEKEVGKLKNQLNGSK